MNNIRQHLMKPKIIPVLFWLLWMAVNARAEAVWQWSVPLDSSRAFLWIPPGCEQVRAVVVGQNNMIEQGILEHDFFRMEMAKLGIAEIFIAPPFETWQTATNNDAANEKFDALLQTLADESGYGELSLRRSFPSATRRWQAIRGISPRGTRRARWRFCPSTATRRRPR